MRYYVLCISDEEDIAPYILAEVVRELLESGDNRESTIASALAGTRSVIATREELMSGGIGKVALAAWDARDDTAFDQETGVLQHRDDEAGRPRLRLVTDATKVSPARASKDSG